MRSLVVALVLMPNLSFAQTRMRLDDQITDLRVVSLSTTTPRPLRLTSTPDWVLSVGGFDRMGVTATRLLNVLDSTMSSRPTAKDLGPWARLVYEGEAPASIQLAAREEGELTLTGDSLEVTGAFRQSRNRRLIVTGRRIHFLRDTTGTVFVTASSVRVEP
jgi:hypothetical protein